MKKKTQQGLLEEQLIIIISTTDKLTQVNSLFVTTSSYPNRKTLIYREEFCIVTNRLIKKCKSFKRKPLDSEYPNICTLIQPLEDVE